MNDSVSPAEKPSPAWKPISALQRRILGVLGEKAKTTPDEYPLSLNALTNGCNQKSNRSPQMNLESIRVEEALEELRALGAVTEVQGGGRVARFRHHLKEWLGVDKAEIAVMIELLLRGSQTVGELRGRASRMEPIADVAALRPILQALIQRELVISLTPEGRGQIVTHGLYLEQEMEKVRAEADLMAASAASAADAAPSGPARTAAPPAATSHGLGPVEPVTAAASSEVAELRAELAELRGQFDRLKSEVEDIWSNLGK